MYCRVSTNTTAPGTCTSNFHTSPGPQLCYIFTNKDYSYYSIKLSALAQATIYEFGSVYMTPSRLDNLQKVQSEVFATSHDSRTYPPPLPDRKNCKAYKMDVFNHVSKPTTALQQPARPVLLLARPDESQRRNVQASVEPPLDPPSPFDVPSKSTSLLQQMSHPYSPKYYLSAHLVVNPFDLSLRRPPRPDVNELFQPHLPPALQRDVGLMPPPSIRRPHRPDAN